MNNATVLGLHDVRFWGDAASEGLIDDAMASYRREVEAWRKAGNTSPLPPANFLAVSGGGENGAFGAGLLVGWTAHGDRPQFKLVTGISTGALTAPFAFLGSRYDAQLKEVYTTLTAKDVIDKRGFLAVLTDDGLASSTPLRRTISRYLTQSMLDDIAAEYRRGRLLLIGTTDLDQGRPVIWDIGKLAASGRPGALKLIQDILVASAAIPGAFSPVMINVEVNEHPYQEMHVDGGASAQVFVYPPRLNLGRATRALGIKRERYLYVIRNARLDPEWAEVNRSIFSIAGRSISSLIQTQGLGDLYRIYLSAERDNIDFNLASIPASFKMKLRTSFDTTYMNALFQLGYDQGRAGYPWTKVPPGFDRLEGETPASGSQPISANTQ